MIVEKLPTVFDFFSDAIENNMVKDALDQHCEALVTFLVDKPNHSQKLEAIGSGFFVASKEPTIGRLFTARHVLETFEKIGCGHISVGKKLLKITSEVGRRLLDPTQDIGGWEIPSNFLIQQIGKISAGILPEFERDFR